MAARVSKRLSAVAVANLKVPGRYNDGDGLYLHVRASGSKSWIIRFRRDGRLQEMGLGSFKDLGLGLAREKADQVRRLLRDGKNPIIERKLGGIQERQCPTFLEFKDEYIAAIEGQWKNAKHKAQWKRTLDVYAKPLHDMRIREIETSHVYELLKPLWNKLPETASRLRGRIERVLSAATTAGHREGLNPARWGGHMENLLPKPKKLYRGHFAAMPYEEVPQFVRGLRGHKSKAAKALEFHILTASRPGMVEQMRLEHIDWDNSLWTIPKEYMKIPADHTVPLTPRAMEILRGLKHTTKTGYVFWAQRRGTKISNATLKYVMTSLGAGDYTPHGFRSSFRDWAGDETLHEEDVAERALAHTVGSETQRAYRRRSALKKRRDLLTDWAGFIEGRSSSEEGKYESLHQSQ